MSGLFHISFQGLPDPRAGNARRHDLLEMLTIALKASICGAESCVAFALFARDRRALFEEFLELKSGLPSHHTFSRIFRLLEPVAFARCFEQFLGHLGEDGAGVLAISLRCSFDRAAGCSALHVVTAFASGARMVAGQRSVAAGENKITAARALLQLFTLKSVLVTAACPQRHARHQKQQRNPRTTKTRRLVRGLRKSNPRSNAMAPHHWR
ncbi:DDE family transposase [Nitrospirillum pindoramense]|uniref:DDE family transposase n=1 Tax=Nitrospirillum amazonense TaxID=28077 RepID=A0A560HAU1_9PROT|nr:DDE family transposase [Nitrospirillum amazonense]